MRQFVKRGIRIAGAIVLAEIFLLAVLLSLQAKLPSRATSLGATTHISDMGSDILPESGAYHGAIVRGVSTQPELVDLFETIANKRLSVIKVYQHFHNGDFYEDWASFIHERGAIEFLSFDPTIEKEKEEEGEDLSCCEVLSGTYDSIVVTFARHIKSWGQPLMLSFAGEMNGNWAGWSGAYNFGSDCVTYTEVSNLYASYGCTDTERIDCADGPERYREMYRHIHEIFAVEGVTNVTWVWAVNHESIPITTWNQIDNYYPGDEYVDVISVDGYNWGDDGPGGCQEDHDPGWKTFDQIFSATLTSLSATYHPTKALILGEFASVEGTDSMSKANWIADAYSRIKSDWPQIKAVIWFNFLGKCSLPIESSLESMWAYRQAVADLHFIGDYVCCCSYLPAIFKSY